MQWQKITLAGVGLLGGSLGLAIKERRLADQVTGLVRRKASLAECTRLGVVDLATLDPQQAADGAELVILCSPVAQMAEMVKQMMPALKRGAIVTDVGSVKGGVVREVEPLVAAAGGHFVGSHPMAGAEKTGPGASRADLFRQAICVITPTRRSSPRAVKLVEAFWKSVGSLPLRLSPEAHDQLVSRSSHLPHVVAAVLANFVLDPARDQRQARLCANGFRDTTRIASSSPEMWRDIVLSNAHNLSRALGGFITDLQKLRGALDAGNAKAIEKLFAQARRRRDAWCAKKVSPSPE